MNSHEILDGWCRLRREQPHLIAREIAEQLGVKLNTLRSVVQRGRDRGDPRAVPARLRQFDLCTLDEGEQPTTTLTGRN